LGQLFQTTSDDLEKIAFGAGLATAISAIGEVPTVGLDTPATIATASVTAIAADASFVTGGLAAALNSFVNGNPSALADFDFDQIVDLAAKFAASKLPGISQFADSVGDLASQAASISHQAQQGCK
jgi:hypothetical protein